MDPVAAASRVLIVAPDHELGAALAAVASQYARAEACSSFRAARARLNATTYDLIATDLRLQEYNGLHLVYLSQRASTPPRAIVYDKYPDLGVAADVRRAGAFFEIARRLLVTLPSYLTGRLPHNDRRTPTTFDRRTSPRGGRRLWDHHVVNALATNAEW